MTEAPSIQDTAVTEKPRQKSRTLPTVVKGARAPPIQRAVKNGIKIPTQKCVHRRINFGQNKREKIIPVRINIRGVQRRNTEKFATEREITENKTTLSVTERPRKRKGGPEKNDGPPSMIGARRNEGAISKRIEPRGTLSRSQHMNLLEADYVKREMA